MFCGIGTIRSILKNVKNTYWGVLLSSKVAGITLLHGCFSRFLNCTNGTKSRDASHMYFLCINPLDTVRKLNSHKAFRRRPKRFMELSCTFNIRPVSRAVFTLCLYCVSINRNSRKACATIFGLRQRWAISERNAWRHYNKSDNPKVAHALWERRGKDTPGCWHVLWIALLNFEITEYIRTTPKSFNPFFPNHNVH